MNSFATSVKGSYWPEFIINSLKCAIVHLFDYFLKKSVKRQAQNNIDSHKSQYSTLLNIQFSQE